MARIVYGHRYYGRVDRAPGLFHFATLFFHVNYVPIYPLQTCLIREAVGGCWDDSGPSVGLRLKSVLVGYLRGWLKMLSGFLAFGGGFMAGLSVQPLSAPAGFIAAVVLACALGLPHSYVLTEEPRGRGHPATARLFWQIGLSGLTLVVGGGQLLVAAVVLGMTDVKAARQMLHVLPLVACAVLAASEVVGYGYRLSLLWTTAGYDRALDLAAEFGVSRGLVERRFR